MPSLIIKSATYSGDVIHSYEEINGLECMNRSEDLVYKLCRESFLSLWSYANPKGKNGKELCDVLIVSDPDIIIISVKDIELKTHGDVSVNWK